MGKATWALLCAAALAGAGCTIGTRSGSGAGIDRAGGDPSVRAQDDFFRRVNGRWLKATEFPADKAYLGSFEALHDKIQVELRGLVEKAARTRANADEARIADL
jgi:putative endopeptidase